MKKLTIFLILSLTLTKAFTQDLDSIKMELLNWKTYGFIPTA